MVLVIFNLILLWFNLMGFFNYSPAGVNVPNTGGILGFTATNVWALSILTGGIAIIAAAISRITGVNLIKMVLYMEIFWIPYVTTMDTFSTIFNTSPESFLWFASIFSLVMIFVFAYDLYEMSGLEFVN